MEASYTDEDAQDAIGGILDDGTIGNVVFNYDDSTPKISATVQPSEIKLDDLAAPDDNTDLNASTSKHGLILKATAPASGIRNVVAIDNTETVYKDAALVDSVDPEALAAAASPGTQLVAARRDHVHAVPKLDDCASPDDNTDLDASTSKHGLLKKLDNDALHAMLGTGAWGHPDASKWDGAAKTVSTDDPSGGSNGDIWFKYTA